MIAFGPVEDPFFYGPDDANHESGIARERTLRAPINFLDAVQSRTIVIEGSSGNIDSLIALREKNAAQNGNLLFVEARGQDHFGVLSPVNRILANKIMQLAPGEALSLSTEEISR